MAEEEWGERRLDLQARPLEGIPGWTCCSHVLTCEGVPFRSGGPKRTQPLAGPPTDTPALATNLSQGPSGFPNVSLESQAFSPIPPTISILHLATAGLGSCSAPPPPLPEVRSLLPPPNTFQEALPEAEATAP